MPVPKATMTIGAIDGRIFISGGSGGFPLFYNTTEVYDPGTDLWTAAPPNGMQRSWNSGSRAVIGDVLYTIAGNPHGTCTNFSQAFDVSDNTWTTIAALPELRCHAATVAHDGRVLVFGGTNASSTVRYTAVQSYDPTTNAWSNIGTLPQWRVGASAGSLGGSVYVLGGATATEGCSASMDIYDPATNSWSAAATWPRPRCAAAVAEHNDRLFVVGGFSIVGGVAIYSNEVDSYDPGTDSWQTETPMPTARASLGAAVVDGILYAIGGSTASGVVPTVEALVTTTLNSAPTAVLSDVTGTEGESVSFDGSASFDADGDALTFHWDFGDGSTGTGVTVQHVYANEGEYTVALTVSDGDAEGSATATARITAPPPTDIAIVIAPSVIRMNDKGRGSIAVSVLSTSTFDATSLDLGTVMLGDGAGADAPVRTKPNGAYQVSLGDVDADGDVDLVAHFRRDALLGELGTSSTATLVLRGVTDGGAHVQGSYVVRVIR